VDPKKTDDNVTPSGNKRSKKLTDLQTNIQIIEQNEEGARTSAITKRFILPWSTVDSIVKYKDRYKSGAKSVSGDVRLLRSREGIFVQLEQRLVAWILEKEKCGERLASAFIRENAKSLFEMLKQKDPECKSEFTASRGWFNHLVNRNFVKRVVMGGKAASADVGLENAGKYKSEIDALYAC
jgi:hypothetical protein